jgi:hypothetical protein
MNAPAPRYDWVDANQRLLAAELARLKSLFAGAESAEARAEVDRCRSALAAPAPIDLLVERFELSEFERDLLLLVAGVEMDSEFGALCAAAAGAASRPWANLSLALAILPGAHWSALTPARPLRRWRLVETMEDATLASARLKIDERVLHYLAGIDYLDPRLQPLMLRIPEPSAMADTQQATAQAILERLQITEAVPPVLQLWGNDRHGKRDVAGWVAARAGLQLYAIACEDIPAELRDLDAFAVLWQREAALADGALLVECKDAEQSATARRLIERTGGLVLLAANEPTTLDRENLCFRIDKPDRVEQRGLWERALGAMAARLGPALDEVASEFRLSARDINRMGAALAREAPLLRDPQAALWRACRGPERLRLNGLAQRIEAFASWDDLILPAPQKTMLREIAMQVRHRLTVYENWGFAAKSARGLGLSALFAGESGTGKTMAAEVLANELHLDLYRIDLSAVVSKYIGETEKNLARLFDAAEDSGAILLFDEADALFGKRSEVKDSHDRYANIEVSYLLQRMEAYRGLAILTSNQKAALDAAFQRRLRFVVHFPFPDAAEREAIWRRVFPAATPLRDLDYAKLARLHMAGGHIRSIALNAAFRAAEAAEPVGMMHLLQSAYAEAAKRDRPLSDGETRGWV